MKKMRKYYIWELVQNVYHKVQQYSKTRMKVLSRYTDHNVDKNIKFTQLFEKGWAHLHKLSVQKYKNQSISKIVILEVIKTQVNR